MPNKALTIDVNTSATPNGSLDNWTPLGNTTVFINNIQTPQLSKNTNVGQLVSGIPTAFARVDLFKTALNHVANDHSSTGQNLVAYYRQLVEEWRGLIACMALDYAHITVRKIDLTYSDGKSIGKTANLYEPKGAFGNMLLERAKRWCDQTLTANQTSSPFINVIKYRGQVVGATAPESLLFTSTGYKCEPSEDRPWIDVVTGKFIDPLKSRMTATQVATLHAYVVHLVRKLGEVEEYYSNLPEGLKVDYTSIRRILELWKSDIERYAENEEYELSVGSTPPVSAAFAGPFANLFCHKDQLYGLEGEISENKISSGVLFDPKNLLLDEGAHIAKIILNVNASNVKDIPILALTADVKGSDEKAYFALPLSAQGLNVYGKNVAALLGLADSTSAITSTLKAVYDPSLRTGNLEVTLTIKTASGSQRQFKKVYTSDCEIKNKDILIWHNFISPQWDAYFMYNELPHNNTSQNYRAFPFVGQMEGDYFRIIVNKAAEKDPMLLSKDGKIVAPKESVEAELLVISDGAVADNPYKYEIYRSNKPFKGVRLLSPTGNEGGYLLVNYSSAQGTKLPHDWMRQGASPQLNPVRLGVDFGSTNTSIAYSSDSTQEQGFEFENQRISLFGNELPGQNLIPRENQVFFFQGAGPAVKSNAIKSVLTIHDNRRLPALKQGETLKMRNEREVVGGFPSFADNLPFSNSDKNKITLRYPNGVGEVTQIHNMKWEDTDDDKAHKSAFLRTLMLQVYASLFTKGYIPTSVKWSYPSAMSGQLLYSYQSIWQTLETVSPVLDTQGDRYKLNVSRYVAPVQIGDDTFGSGSFGSPDSTNGFGQNDGFGGGFGSASDDFGGGFGDGFGGGFGNTDNSFGNADSGFSDTSAGFGSFGEQQVAQPTPKSNKDMLPDDPNAEVTYSPKPIYTMTDPNANPSLSEAEAVANFISVRYGKEANVLNLCFDVGGSTTDISALFYLSNGITMIKQNSLRFAAQRVSQAVAKFPSFKKVLCDICARYKIQMVGLNFGNDTYNEHTAPYFFDQIVNRLNDDQLRSLYQSIASDCPKLMCVNLYVTGLLMYYAGQIAHKLIDDLKRTPDTEWTSKAKPNVRISFAGKGSRLFQWLKVINEGAANSYYGKMFVLGYGRDALLNSLAGWQRIELPQLKDENIKYEVSKGLAKGDTDLFKPSVEQPTEIIGETGFELVGNDKVNRSIDFTNSITGDMLGAIGVRLRQESGHNQADKFTEFCGLFYQAASTMFGWKTNPKALNDACRNMSIISYVQNMPEFRSAESEARRSGASFSFVAPIIILEGMKFYDETLLKML